MSLSQSEYKIKSNLEKREIAPSKTLWDNIQQELDIEKEPKKSYLWYKVASVAAVFCIVFLIYQGLTGTKAMTEQFVIESQPVKLFPIDFETQKNLSPIVLQMPEVQEPNLNSRKQNIIKTKVEVAETMEQNTLSHHNTDNVAEAQPEAITAAEQNVLLTQEVNALLEIAMKNTTDTEQKKALLKLEASLLLAEAEDDSLFEKPKGFEDKIWEAIVANFNDIKKNIIPN